MDPRIIQEEAVLVLVERALEDPKFGEPREIVVPELLILGLLRPRLPDLRLEDLRRALAEQPKLFEPYTLNQPFHLGELHSKEGYCVHLAKAHPKAWSAKRADFEGLVAESAAKPRPAIPALHPAVLELGDSGELQVRNYGFGGLPAVQPVGVEGPGWLRCELRGHQVLLDVVAEQPGLYEGYVTVRTAAGAARAQVMHRRESLLVVHPAKLELVNGVGMVHLSLKGRGGIPKEVRVIHENWLSHEWYGDRVMLKARPLGGYRHQGRVRIETSWGSAEVQVESEGLAAALSHDEVYLGTGEVHVGVHNRGVGGDELIHVLSVVAPDFIRVSQGPRELRLRADLPGEGVFSGNVVIGTNAGMLNLRVRAERLAFTAPSADEVRLADFVHPADGADVFATEQRARAFLEGLGYQALPGGYYVRATNAAPRETGPIECLLSQSHLAQGVIPVPLALPAEVRLSDGEGDFGYTARYDRGHLHGLGDLFRDYEVTPGQRMTLEPMPGGFRFTFAPGDPLELHTGYRYWLVGQPAALEESGVERHLTGWVRSAEVNVLLTRLAPSSFGEHLVNLHRAAGLTLCVGQAEEQAAVYIEGEGVLRVDLVSRQVEALSSVDPLLEWWRRAQLVDERDYRQAARTDDQLLDLALSPSHVELQEALSPLSVELSPEEALQRHGIARAQGAPPAGVKGVWGCWYRSLELHERLVKLRDLVERLGAERLHRARPLLERYGLTPEQVAIWGGLHITRGGWLAVRGISVAAVTRGVVEQVDGPLHHSQLRKLVEAFLGSPLQPMQFLNLSRQHCGWAGPGYRRAHLPGEPQSKTLAAVVEEGFRLGHTTESQLLMWALRYLNVGPEALRRQYWKVVGARNPQFAD